jgi:hypothetical protein
MFFQGTPFLFIDAGSFVKSGDTMFLYLLFVLFILLPPHPLYADDTVTVPVRLDNNVMASMFSGHELMHYTVSWSGGIKIGDLFLAVEKAGNSHGFVLKATVKDYGLFRLFYPVDDTFTTLVLGPLKLPYRYEVEQKEGHGSTTTQRLTVYDQQNLQVSYRKNKGKVKEFSITGPVYNEFSSFFITRALNFRGGQQIVPTFVDEKRHEVVVVLLGRENIKKTLFGDVDTLKVMPKMDFKGLYDKDGDTVFWLTDDSCRIPVVINSKIMIGSLTAELVEYTNPACLARTGGKKKRQQVIGLGD